MNSNDFYKILGVSKSASQDEIKKAYRKLAMHNKKEAEEMFKKIGEAYSCLSKPDQREIYDKYGKEGLQQGFQPRDNSRHFSDFGGNFERGGFGGFGNFDEFERDFFKGRSSFEKNGFGFGFNNFTFERAEQIFKDFFSNEGFFNDDEEDFFSFGFGKNKIRNDQISKMNKKKGVGRGFGFGMFDDDDDDFGFGKDPFANDPFFSKGFKKDLFKRNSEFSNFTSDLRGGTGAAKSVSQSTIIKNGKKVSVTKTSIRNPDGTTHSEIHEKIDDGPVYKENKYIDMPERKKTHALSYKQGERNDMPKYQKSYSTKYYKNK